MHAMRMMIIKWIKLINQNGKVVTNILSESNSKSIFIPPGFAHGFCSLDKENYIIYSCTKYRDTTSEKTILYKDKDLNIKWPTLNPIISVKDNNGITFRDFKKKYFKWKNWY